MSKLVSSCHGVLNDEYDTGAADHGVCAAKTVEHVVAARAVDPVGTGVAGVGGVDGGEYLVVVGHYGVVVSGSTTSNVTWRVPAVSGEENVERYAVSRPGSAPGVDGEATR